MATIVFYFFVFLSIYIQVFLLVTFLERRRELIPLGLPTRPNEAWPSVTIIIPCYNEKRTVGATVESLLALDYPKDKLKIFLVDDGSTDDTLAVMENFKDSPQVRIFRKENGGKYTALNLGLAQADTELVGCLDADSFVVSEALKRMAVYFDKPETMAVSPSIIVHRPRNLLERAQFAEYHWSVYIKKMLAFLGAIHVTPGPFSIYRREVFERIGHFRPAHNTEDMEIAYRMQRHRMKIEQCHDAFVYTVSPRTVPKLYHQRLRWIYGFLNNTLDYRRLLFRPGYGNFALFTVPAGLISISAALYLLGRAFWNIAEKVADKISALDAVGWRWAPHLDWFYLNTRATLFLVIILYGLVILAILLGRRIAEGRWRPSWDILLLIFLYTILAPFWLLRAVYSTVFAKPPPAWR